MREVCMAKTPTAKTPDWKVAIADGKLKLSSSSESKAKGLYPNQLGWIEGQPGIGLLVVFQADTDFAVNKGGLHYVYDAEQERRIETGYLLLLRRRDGKIEYVNSAPIEDAMKIVREVPPSSGEWGDYWWIPADIRPVTSPF
jgi:hypothetical protein